MPQRFLRPGIRTSPRWNAISHRAARLYIAILTLVDDHGRYDGRPSVLWADAFAVWNDQNPGEIVTPEQTAADCNQMAAEKLLEFYEVDGRRYLQVVQWKETPRNKSKWPSPVPFKQPPMAAETCQNLPPSSSSSSSSSHTSSSSPSDVQEPLPSPDTVNCRTEVVVQKDNHQAIEELRKGLCDLFKRKPEAKWTYAEETALKEVCDRPEWESELNELCQFNTVIDSKDRKYGKWPNSVHAMLEQWPKWLDVCRNYVPENQNQLASTADKPYPKSFYEGLDLPPMR